MDRKIRLMIAACFVFVLLISIFAWGTASVNVVQAKQKAELTALRMGEVENEEDD